MTQAQRWSIAVGVPGLLVVIAGCLQWFTRKGESISGFEFGAAFVAVPGGIVALGGLAAFVDRNTPTRLNRLFLLGLYCLMWLFVSVLPLSAMDTTLAMEGPGVPLTAFSVLAGGCVSFVWLLMPVPKYER